MRPQLRPLPPRLPLCRSAVDSSPSQFTYTYSLTGLQPASAYYFTVVPDVDAAEKNVGNATGLAVSRQGGGAARQWKGGGVH